MPVSFLYLRLLLVYSIQQKKRPVYNIFVIKQASALHFYYVICYVYPFGQIIDRTIHDSILLQLLYVYHIFKGSPSQRSIIPRPNLYTQCVYVFAENQKLKFQRRHGAPFQKKKIVLASQQTRSGNPLFPHVIDCEAIGVVSFLRRLRTACLRSRYKRYNILRIGLCSHD